MRCDNTDWKNPLHSKHVKPAPRIGACWYTCRVRVIYGTTHILAKQRHTPSGLEPVANVSARPTRSCELLLRLLYHSHQRGVVQNSSAPLPQQPASDLQSLGLNKTGVDRKSPFLQPPGSRDPQGLGPKVSPSHRP